MDKETLLNILGEKVNTGEISREEVSLRLGLGTAMTAPVPARKSETSVTKVLYSVGAIVVILGVVILIAQLWDDLGSAGRILMTLGLGVLISGIGSMLMISKPEEKIGAVFHAIGGATIPGGVMVFLSETLGPSLDIWPVVWSFGTLFLLYVVLTSVHKHAILTFFAIGHGTAFIYLLTGALVEDANLYYGVIEDIFVYLTMVVGACYLLLAHIFTNTWNGALGVFLRFFGSMAFLGAAFSRIFDSGIWQFAFFLLVLGGMYLATVLRSKEILLSSMLFLFAYIIYITSEYFADSLGWPVSLVILGFVLIGLGYVWVHIQRRYIKGEQLTA